MRLQYRILPLAGTRVILETIVDSLSIGTEPYATIEQAQHYVAGVLGAHASVTPAWSPEVLAVVSTQTVEV